MEDAMSSRSIVLKGMAAALNAGGRAVAFALDKTSGAVEGVCSVAGKLGELPGLGRKAAASGAGLFSRGKAREYDKQIREYEKQIKLRYVAIGKQSVHGQDPESTLEKESIQKLIADIREYEAEIERLKSQKNEASTSPRKARPQAERPAAAKAGAGRIEKTTVADLRAVIDRTAKKAVFDSPSQQATFRKIAEDLLDEELEIRMLAAAELGKSGMPAAVVALLAAARLDDPELTTEIINALINLGDARALDLFTEFAAHPAYRVRMACLRGLYKLGDEDTAAPMLIAALRDEHPEVRRTGVTFLGWKDYPDAVPALVQCLRDEDDSVRKGAVSALANLNDPNAVLPLIKLLGDNVLEIREKALEAVRGISGEDLAFDVTASGAALEAAINETLNWWQRQRSGPDAAMARDAVQPDAGSSDAPEAAAQPEQEPAATVAAAAEEVEPAPFDTTIFGSPEMAQEKAPEQDADAAEPSLGMRYKWS